MDLVYWSLAIIFALLGLWSLYRKLWFEAGITGFIAAIIVLTVIQVNQYPDFVKNLYIKNPHILVLAQVQQVMAGEPGVNKTEAKQKALAKGFGEIRSAKLIYLCSLDLKAKGVKNTRELYFKSLSKVPIESTDTLYWYIKGWDEEQLIEQSTGKVIYYKKEGKVILPTPTQLYLTPKARKVPYNYTQYGIKSIFLDSATNVYTDNIQKDLVINSFEDYQQQSAHYQKALIKALLKYDKALYGQAPTKEDEGNYRILMAKIERNYRSIWGDAVDDQMIIPTYVEKAIYQNQTVWIVVCNWAPASELDKPGAKKTGVSLAHRAVLVMSTDLNAKLLYYLTK